jgi:hypothetical protein
MKKSWKNRTVGLVLFGLAMSVGGCLPFPLGDPDKSQVDEKLAGYWMAEDGESRELYAMFPFDQHTYVLEDLKLKKDGDKWQADGPAQLYKCWLTDIKGTRFLTLDPLQQRLPGTPTENRTYPVVKLIAERDQILVRALNTDFEPFKTLKSSNDVRAVIEKNLNNPDMFATQASTLHRLDPERDQETLQPLVNH